MEICTGKYLRARNSLVKSDFYDFDFLCAIFDVITSRFWPKFTQISTKSEKVGGAVMLFVPDFCI